MTSKISSLLIDFNNIININLHEKLINKIQPIPNRKHNIGLILVISQEQLYILKKIPKGHRRVAYLNTDYFVNTITGYAYIIYDKQKKICELTNINGFVIKEVLISILSGIPNDVTIWVGISLNDENFLTIIEEYISVGFSDPYICKESPLGFKFSSYGFCMLKKNDIDLKQINAYNEINYVLEQFVKMKEQSCSISLKLTLDSIKYLKQLSKIGSTVNNNGSISQKEISGIFTISNSDTKKKYFLLEVDRNSILLGKEESVFVRKGLYTFHTHPQEAYDRNKVLLAWPSAQDYIGFLSHVKQYKAILHAVISLEGIYFLSISNYWIDNLENIENDSTEFIFNFYNIQHSTEKNVNNYLKQVNNISYKGFPLFTINFFEWNNASTLITIPFRKEGINCFFNDKSLKKYIDLYK